MLVCVWVGFLGCQVRLGFVYRWRVLVGVGLMGVGWLCVEICIVDASIFVVKLSRANGGCLGTRSR